VKEKSHSRNEDRIARCNLCEALKRAMTLQSVHYSFSDLSLMTLTLIAQSNWKQSNCFGKIVELERRRKISRGRTDPKWSKRWSV